MRLARVLLSLALLPAGVASTEAAALRLYMSPSGDDHLCGTSELEAVRSLRRIHECLQEMNPDSAVEVHIKPGRYLHHFHPDRPATVEWTYYNGKPITFTPLGFGTERPVFEGRGADIWFHLKVADGVRTELRFRYLRVQNYNSAIVFHGNYEEEHTGWNGGNRLYGMYFYRIGGLYSNKGSSTAAVSLANSRDNSIVNSHFINIQNHGHDAGQLHAIYIAHYSYSNVIIRNRFAYINGEPVRVRDASGFNRIRENTFSFTGMKAYYSEWFCRTGCTKDTPECPSMGNDFRDNHLYGGYLYPLGRPALFKLYGPADACGPLPRQRLYTSGNVVH
jgi:hypothetical protein